jgi:hypothetical protein
MAMRLLVVSFGQDDCTTCAARCHGHDEQPKGSSYATLLDRGYGGVAIMLHCTTSTETGQDSH